MKLNTKQCIKTGFVSSVGNFVNVFERKIKNVTGSKYVVAVINGTYALELIIRCLKINKNEEVFFQRKILSFFTANAIKHTGAIPHFVDVEENNLGICPEKLENYIKKSLIKKNGKLFNPKTKKIYFGISRSSSLWIFLQDFKFKKFEEV